MNMLDLLKDKWMESWTGGLTGQPGRFHGPGTFDNFKFSDFFNNKNWVREADPTAPGGMRNYYRPGDSKTVKTVLGKDGKQTTTTTIQQTGPNPKEIEDDFTKNDPYPYPSFDEWINRLTQPGRPTRPRDIGRMRPPPYFDRSNIGSYMPNVPPNTRPIHTSRMQPRSAQTFPYRAEPRAVPYLEYVRSMYPFRTYMRGNKPYNSLLDESVIDDMWMVP